MTVGELIKALSEHNNSATVRIEDEGLIVYYGIGFKQRFNKFLILDSNDNE